jgi:hypothetical protein
MTLACHRYSCDGAKYFIIFKRFLSFMAENYLKTEIKFDYVSLYSLFL